MIPVEYILLIKDIKGVGDKALLNILKNIDSHTFTEFSMFCDFLINNKEIFGKRSNLDEIVHSINQIKNADLKLLEKQKLVSEWKSKDIGIILFNSPDYPSGFKRLSSPPPVVFYRGNVNLLKEEKIIGVVGTRNNTPKGKAIAEGTVNYFSSKGAVILSGLAIGIDSIAHRACLDNHGKTISVLVDVLNIAPKVNSALGLEIIEKNGLLIAENLPGYRIFPHDFAKRDRLQAALVHALFPIETSINGGTMHSVNQANQFNIPVWVPDTTKARYDDFNIPQVEGIQYLIEEKRATAYTSDNYEEIFELLGKSNNEPQQYNQALLNL